MLSRISLANSAPGYWPKLPWRRVPVLLSVSDDSDWRLIDHIRTKGRISDAVGSAEPDGWQAAARNRLVQIPSPFENMAPELRQELEEQQKQEAQKRKEEYARRTAAKARQFAAWLEERSQWRERKDKELAEAQARQARWQAEQDFWENFWEDNPVNRARAELERRNAQNKP